MMLLRILTVLYLYNVSKQRGSSGLALSSPSLCRIHYNLYLFTINLVGKYFCVSAFTIQFQMSQDFAVRQREVMVNNNINREQSKVYTER